MAAAQDGALRFARPDEVDRWDELVEAAPGGGEVWQSREYAVVKRHQRYADRYVVAADGAPEFPATLVLEKRVPVLGRIWYVPGGPAAGADPITGAETTPAEIVGRAVRLADFARANGAFLLKIEPRLILDEGSRSALAGAGFVRAPRILPNESTVLLDISGDEAEVMGRFSSSTRTKIRKADKIGFETRRVEATDENCRTMYRLLGETGEGRFQLRPYEYYRDFWQTFQSAGRGQLVLGYAEGEPVAGMFATALGRTSGYKDGASTKTGNLPNGAMYRMQWELILWGREHGATVHDLIGSPPSDRVDDRDHPLYGVGQYKLRLSKEVTDYVGVWDLPLRGFAAKVWNTIGERIARRWALAVRKDVYY